MKIWTVRLNTVFTVFALIELVVFRVVLKLFPSMRMITSVLILAPISVIAYILLRTPVTALLFSIIIQLWLPSKILPVMCINTLITLVFCFIVRTPNSLKMEHIEVRVVRELVNQLNWNFWFRMRKWAVIAIFTLSSLFYKRSTKLGFIFIRMIEFLNTIMSLFAFVTFRTFPIFNNWSAYFWLIWS
jgi:hypothetical protein